MAVQAGRSRRSSTPVSGWLGFGSTRQTIWLAGFTRWRLEPRRSDQARLPATVPPPRDSEMLRRLRGRNRRDDANALTVTPEPLDELLRPLRSPLQDEHAMISTGDLDAVARGGNDVERRRRQQLSCNEDRSTAPPPASAWSCDITTEQADGSAVAACRPGARPRRLAPSRSRPTSRSSAAVTSSATRCWRRSSRTPKSA